MSTGGKMKERAVLVTTDKRGVFFGYTSQPAAKDDSPSIVLMRARMVVYWSAETKGVLGLAATGPAEGSRVTPPVPVLTLAGVTAVGECTKEAVKALEAAPWA